MKKRVVSVRMSEEEIEKVSWAADLIGKPFSFTLRHLVQGGWASLKRSYEGPPSNERYTSDNGGLNINLNCVTGEMDWKASGPLQLISLEVSA